MRVSLTFSLIQHTIRSAFRSLSWLALSWLLLVPLSSIAQAQIDTRILQVSANAIVAVKPDYLSFSVTVEEQGEIAAKINQAVRQKTALILNLLKRADIVEKDIQTAPLQLQPWYQGRGNERQQSGFVIRQVIQIQLRELDEYPRLLDKIMAAGAFRISGGQFSVSNQSALYQQALDAAILNAQEKAIKMAKSLSVRLGTVQQVIENSHFQPQMMVAETASRSFSQPSFMPGQIEVQANVSVTFAIH